MNATKHKTPLSPERSGRVGFIIYTITAQHFKNMVLEWF